MTRPTPDLVGENPELVRGPAECIDAGPAATRSGPTKLISVPRGLVGGFGSSGNSAVRGRQDIYRGPAHPCRFPEPQNGHAWCLTEEAKQEALAEPKDAAAEVLSAADSAGSADDADDAEDDERQQEKERREEERKEKAAAKEQRRMREREEAAVAAAVATAAAKAAESVQRPTDEEAQPPELGADGGAAPEQVDSNPGRMPYSWIRSDNMEPARQARRDIARATRQATVAGAYKKNMGKAPRGDHVRLDKVRAMINGTERLAPSLGNLSVDAEPTGYRSTEISKHDGLTIPVALTLRARHSDRVAVVSAASAYHCGGGFTSGGRHALEEATCVQTTLFESLEKVQIEAVAEFGEAAAGQHVAYIPFDGVILSPFVQVFRGGSDEGYPFLDRPSIITVLSMAMLNRNASLGDAPVDAPDDPHEYEKAVAQKFRSTLTGAIRAGCTAIVFPDVGCGVYKNDPKVVGRILGELLATEFWGHLTQVALVGKPEFQDSVVASADAKRAAAKEAAASFAARERR
eukprot:CAMPEP_0115106440 /NCGR_PEP_ID=MMETSP0227-20121206/36659_1 /TAXON_ID=89957 /ORGANISM="Polarella glacialis, Strain CCMP 1383" /LENGTH=518 /DNA_ID=CAMNT_0002504043 /DNA_START=116 /DNA_END=1668 /DNA_ORIENTATION=-